MTRIDWQGRLKEDCTKAGPRSSLRNAVEVLRTEPLWRPDRLYYDEFLDRVMIANSPVREWNDRDDSRVTLYMQEMVGMRTISSNLVNEAVKIVADERTRHCIKDWLYPVKFDGKSRIDYAFETYWNADVVTQPIDHVRAASANFFKGMIARIEKPGCKLDNMVVFEGGTGHRKSTALEVVGGDWYASARGSAQEKDFLQSLPGKMIMEIAEMHTFSRAEIACVKGLMSTRIDRYRPSYGRSARDYPRQSIFAGTTNKYDWGDDETGLRRFWPIRCGKIDIESLRVDRNQLFAEALVRVKSGESWWEMPDSTLTVQAERQIEHPWMPKVEEWLSNPELNEITATDLLVNGVGKDHDKLTKADKSEAVRMLTLLGWTIHVLRNGTGKQRKRWMRPVESDEETF